MLWAPGDGLVDLDEPGGTELAYRAVLAEGSAADQVRVLDAERLVAVRDRLLLPRRARRLREDRFPRLRPAAA